MNNDFAKWYQFAFEDAKEYGIEWAIETLAGMTENVKAGNYAATTDAYDGYRAAVETMRNKKGV